MDNMTCYEEAPSASHVLHSKPTLLNVQNSPRAIGLTPRVKISKPIRLLFPRGRDHSRLAACVLAVMDQVALLLAAALGWNTFRLWIAPPTLTHAQVKTLILHWIAISLAYHGGGLYPGYGTPADERLRRRLLPLLATFASMLLWPYWSTESAAEPYLVICIFGWALLLVLFSEEVTRGILCRKNLWGTPVVVAGKSPAVSQLVRMLRFQPDLGYVPTAILAEEPQGPATATVPIVSGANATRVLCRRFRTCLVVVNARQTITRRQLQSRLPFERLIVVPDVGNLALLRGQTHHLGGMLGAEIDDDFRIRRHGVYKRILDCLGAIPACLASLPAIALYAIYIQIVDPGPVFFHQERIGLDGKLIRIPKLRTMRVDAERRLNAHLNADAAARKEWLRHFKLRRDPRILPWLGGIYRRFSLDELPQFWTIVKGDMTLVGPRPFPTYHLEALPLPFRELRRSLRPGLTGLWQVRARAEGDHATLEALDTYYICNWSLWLDLYVLVRTVGAVIGGRGAY
jgi:lipopolysaccharide/colanic/teichoic acid biosynthesis glycosyltransferase